jgi:hypothetical protein
MFFEFTEHYRRFSRSEDQGNPEMEMTNRIRAVVGSNLRLSSSNSQNTNTLMLKPLLDLFRLELRSPSIDVHWMSVSEQHFLIHAGNHSGRTFFDIDDTDFG